LYNDVTEGRDLLEKRIVHSRPVRVPGKRSEREEKQGEGNAWLDNIETGFINRGRNESGSERDDFGF
jgi:hypothetical protein